MTPLKTENLELVLDNNIVHMSVSGPIAKESMDAGLDWIHQIEEANDNFSLRVNMPEEDFTGLGQITQQFKRVGTVMRHAKSADKCAVMTDSAFLRNSARVEGSVIPGLEVRSFDLDETRPAERWLNNEPLIQAKDVEIEHSVSDENKSQNAWDNLNVKNLNL